MRACGCCHDCMIGLMLVVFICRIMPRSPESVPSPPVAETVVVDTDTVRAGDEVAV